MTERCEFYIKGRPPLHEAYHYKGAGLPNIYLLNGVTFEDDPDYGELVTIHNLNGLHRAIGLQIVERPTPMTAGEFRFLRKQMKLTQAGLAARMRVSDQTIANYEKGKTQPGVADPHLRFLFLLYILPPDSPAELIRELMDAIGRFAPEPMVPAAPRRRIVDGWHHTTLCVAA
jgi:DNA-binding transcriptional regulator YiaG